MARRRRLLKLLGVATIVGFAGCMSEEKEASSSDYPQDEIRWLVPASPGGGFDAYSRAIAEHFPDHLPNDSEVVVENQSAAGGRVHAIEIYNAEPDGHHIGIWNMPGQLVAQVLGDEDYDVNEITWLGQVVEEPYMFVVGTETPYETVEDLQDADEVLIGGQGPGNTGDLMNLITIEELGFEAEVVRGFEGNSELLASTLRGEIDGFCGSIGSTQVINGITDGDVRAIAAYMVEDDLPDWAEDQNVPTAADIGYEQLSGIMSNFRLIGGPPGMDDQTVDTIEQALLDTLQSDEMQGWAEDAGRPLEPGGAKYTSETVSELGGLMEDYTDTFEEAGW